VAEYAEVFILPDGSPTSEAAAYAGLNAGRGAARQLHPRVNSRRSACWIQGWLMPRSLQEGAQEGGQVLITSIGTSGDPILSSKPMARGIVCHEHKRNGNSKLYEG